VSLQVFFLIRVSMNASSAIFPQHLKAAFDHICVHTPFSPYIQPSKQARTHSIQQNTLNALPSPLVLQRSFATILPLFACTHTSATLLVIVYSPVISSHQSIQVCVCVWCQCVGLGCCSTCYSSSTSHTHHPHLHTR
jgi:hypothetical protein